MSRKMVVTIGSSAAVMVAVGVVLAVLAYRNDYIGYIRVDDVRADIANLEGRVAALEGEIATLNDLPLMTEEGEVERREKIAAKVAAIVKANEEIAVKERDFFRIQDQRALRRAR